MSQGTPASCNYTLVPIAFHFKGFSILLCVRHTWILTQCAATDRLSHRILGRHANFNAAFCGSWMCQKLYCIEVYIFHRKCDYFQIVLRPAPVWVRLVQVRNKVLAELFELETFRTSLCTNTGQENCSRGHIAHLHGSAQYLQHGGLLWDTPPRDLHSIYQCFWALGMCSIYFGGALCDTPPRDLHSFYQCLRAFDMGSFYFGGAFFAHLRAICTVFTTTYAFRRCARLGTL